MEVGHAATKRFLVDVVQNQGRLMTIAGNSRPTIVEQDLPPGNVAVNLLQLRVLSGGNVHLTLVAQNDDANPLRAGGAELLEASISTRAASIRSPSSTSRRSGTWTTSISSCRSDSFRLPNDLQGQALAGDYGVLQSFVVNVENPLATPQSIAIYENPRGGRATGTYIIDGVLVQSHQVPPFSRYKIRQYVVPAHGFVRVTIVTMPEGGIEPFRCASIFAPDDGSVAPGAPGSPVY